MPANAKMFSLVALCLGAFSFFVSPPLGSVDAPSHFLRAYDAFGGDPSDVARFVETNWNRRHGVPDPETVAPPVYLNTKVYSPVNYLPAATALSASRLLGLPVSVGYAAGAIASLVAYVLMVLAAAKALPRQAVFILGAGLVPTFVFLASGYSTDPWNFALSLWFLASCLGPAGTPAILVLAILLALSKPPNAVLLLALAFVPWRPWKKLATLLCAVVACFAWNRQFQGVNVGASLGIAADPEAQLRALAADPFAFADVAIRTVTTDAGWNVADMFVAGRDDAHWIAEAQRNFGRVWLAVPGLALLFAVGVFSARETALKREFAVGVLGLFVLVATLVVVHVGFSPVGSPTVAWLQGRYLFLPFFLSSWPLVGCGRRVLDRAGWYDRAVARRASTLAWYGFAAYAAAALVVMLRL